jgi:hypothetical protein
MDLTVTVGRNGLNRKSDVKRVQELLNRAIRVPYRLLDIDGIVGTDTIGAIERFQKEVVQLVAPDALIEPGKKTWRALAKLVGEVANTQTNGFRKVSQPPSTSAAQPATGAAGQKIAWGAKVSAPFKTRVIAICQELGVTPDYLMACMAFETGESFSPSILNAAGSKAVGLIQFMPNTAKALGTTSEALSQMTAVAQLDYVLKYFKPHKGKLRTLEDVYMAILYPAAIGKPADHALFKDPSKVYTQNKGFDRDKDKQITLAEISYSVRSKYEKGLKPGYFG